MREQYKAWLNKQLYCDDNCDEEVASSMAEFDNVMRAITKVEYERLANVYLNGGDFILMEGTLEAIRALRKVVWHG